MDWDQKIDSARPEGEPSNTVRFEKSGGLGNATDTPDADLLAERDAFYATHPYESFKAAIDAKLEVPAPWWKKFLDVSTHGKWFGTALAGIAAAMIAVVVLPEKELPMDNMPEESIAPTETAPHSGIRSKGLQPRTIPTETPASKSVVKLSLQTHPSVKTPVDKGSRLLPEQRISFSYTSGELDNLYLIGINDAQMPSPLFPEDWSQQSIKIAPGAFPLKETFILDSYLGHERFIAIFSKKPISGKEVQEAALNAIKTATKSGKGVRSIEALPLQVDCAQTSVLIEKVAN